MTDSNVYEIKQNRNWNKVRATSFINLSKYCKANGISDYRMAGMMSRKETEQSKSLKVVA